MGTTEVNAGTTSLSGDLGVTAAAGQTGTPVTTGGRQHIADATAQTAMADGHAAYVDAMGRTPQYTIAGDLANLTFVPGVYTSGGAISLSTTLTFDGQGSTNSVFIVQIGGAFSTAAASHIVLTNSAQASNIYFAVTRGS